jgi:hypothetical protein
MGENLGESTRKARKKKVSVMNFIHDSSISLHTEVQNNILLAEFDVKMIKYRPCLCALFAETKKITAPYARAAIILGFC